MPETAEPDGSGKNARINPDELYSKILTMGNENAMQDIYFYANEAYTG